MRKYFLAGNSGHGGGSRVEMQCLIFPHPHFFSEKYPDTQKTTLDDNLKVCSLQEGKIEEREIFSLSIAKIERRAYYILGHIDVIKE